jgi:hypothetical protein
MIGQPSSPGICFSELRFGSVKVNAGEATLCIDIVLRRLGRYRIAVVNK